MPPSGRELEVLYSLILATLHFGFPNAGGLHQPLILAEHNFVIHGDVEFPKDAVVFYSTPNGDSVIAAVNHTYWHSHEGATEVPAGTVNEFLSAYFDHLLRGTLDNFEFPY